METITLNISTTPRDVRISWEHEQFAYTAGARRTDDGHIDASTLTVHGYNGNPERGVIDPLFRARLQQTMMYEVVEASLTHAGDHEGSITVPVDLAKRLGL